MFLFVDAIVCVYLRIEPNGSVGVCVCVWSSSGGFDPALISQFYQSIQCFVHHVSSLSTITGNVSCDTVHLIKVVCLTISSASSSPKFYLRTNLK